MLDLGRCLLVKLVIDRLVFYCVSVVSWDVNKILLILYNPNLSSLNVKKYEPLPFKFETIGHILFRKQDMLEYHKIA